ncbi:phage tail tip lysozyme [Pseudomonas sp. SDO52101_S400]
MADQDVIKEFLVGLGFKVDQKGVKDFTIGIDNATKTVTRLVTVIAGASLTVAAGVSAFASNLEGLYFASQRVGASAESLKSAEYAARDLGASADEARGSIEGIAKFLRDNPGGEDFLKGIGVQTRDANGNLRDTADMLVNIGQKLKAMPWYQANQYASVLGIDERTLRAIQDDKFGAKLEQNRKKLRDSGLDQATKDAHAFMEVLRSVGLQFETFSIQVQAALMDKLGPDLQRFAEWFQQNGPMIANRIADIAVKIIDFAEKSGPYLQKIWDFFVKLDEATDGWSTKIIALLWALNAIGALSVISGITRLAGAFLSLGTAITGAGAAAAGATALSTLAVGLGAAVYSSSLNEGEDDIVQRRHDAEDAADGRLRGGDDMAGRVMQFFQDLGWSPAQSAGITANLSAESGFNSSAVGDGGKAYGVAQWHPDRQANFEKWAGKDIRQSTLEDQLRFVHYELTEGAEVAAGKLLKAATNSRDAGSTVSRYYERPGVDETARAREAASRGDVANQLHQSTTINVYGATDPNATASAVSGAQSRVNQDITRNLNSAVN